MNQDRLFFGTKNLWDGLRRDLEQALVGDDKVDHSIEIDVIEIDVMLHYLALTLLSLEEAKNYQTTCEALVDILSVELKRKCEDLKREIASL